MWKLLQDAGYDSRKTPLYVTLLSAPVVLTLYHTRGRWEMFLSRFPALEQHPLGQYYAVLLQFASLFLLALVLPLVLNALWLRRSWTDLGLGLGDRRLGLRIMAIGIPLVVPLAWLASLMADVRAEYPEAQILLQRHDLVLPYEAAYLLLYYVAWEFFFRGFLLLGTREALGDFTAVVVQTIPSCLIHLGKPEGEVLGSILAGIVFGIVALRTRSIWYALLIHAPIGILTDVFIVFL
jgi:membrane protease YdiL (CAAX protease family)